ncbi:hypothetical protein T552_01333 [Pneumocystis carinii B80]|uniref:S-(hydroxymethyl)glutathione dehydrogenase n=1 Tax=Pneumocystis carinii (strain B80) TaxID=1408658 RepID=A0A0W4ZLY0_PNEC8|nr:hypothetical protein T552_01333 [Pneumocystis carinii B80]KTW29379.1 hypothetical protein T552_01333 [Pneumocystis carinii B80]
MSNTKRIRCKAAIAWELGKELSYEEIEVLAPKAHEVRVKIIWSALCHTDVYTLMGKDEARFPMILGHEGAGIVESVGKGVIDIKEGDHVLVLYIPECRMCKFCLSGKTNLCMKINETQAKGTMPDGTTRFRANGREIFHFMGASTFSQYTVIPDISLVVISKEAPLDKICLLGCGITSGYGAAIRSSKIEPGSTIAVFGIGCVGLSVIQGAVASNARKIVAIDINSDKESWARKFVGDTDFEFVNPLKMDVSVRDYLIEISDGGFDYTFDCTGNVHVMEQALEVSAKGWGKLCIIGSSLEGKKLCFAPFLVVTGRQIIGSAFGGIKGRSEIPQLVELYMKGQLKLDEYITHKKNIKTINEGFQIMKTGNCIRCICDMQNVT